ncbi:LPS export ABC transporter periplasmic protein LptC [Mucilaginibacter agri]|uniref:LPS export ABC transporter periplasmic protein LptC n=1 Tax=Mucilaginibacter agri TaxID=2695265 RepID=A0A966DSQ9_9SPHI|nr:LPS export ABC transporter periplasmic protein LptC [Mucilaginibacter agri]NCD70433.1 LPS export ABC transporter periplasmic protein LptC [Mucilaginibacter agri]
MVKPYIWLLMLATTLLCACENDLKKIQEISAKETSAPVQRTTGVDVIYSDSAKVKIHMEAPLLMQYTTKNPYDEMPKGVKISFLDSNAVTTSTITSEYGVRRINEKLIELDKNVVATNEKGDVFRSDQLIWDQTTRKVTSKKPVSITSTDGSVIYGSTLTTNEKFDPWDITQTTGKFNVKQNITP